MSTTHGRSAALLVALAACSSYSDPTGVEFAADPGIVAVGARSRFSVNDSCDDSGPGLLVIPVAHAGLLILPLPPGCLESRVTEVLDVSSSNPHAIEITGHNVEEGVALFEVEALAEGAAELAVTVDTDRGEQYTVRGEMRARAVETVDLAPTCATAGLDSSARIPAGATMDFTYSLYAKGGVKLSGHGLLPFDFAGLPAREVLGALQHVHVDFPAEVTSVTFTSPIDPSFSQTYQTYDVTSFTGVELRGASDLVEMGRGQYLWEAVGLLGDLDVCADPFMRRVWTDTPDVCAFQHLGGTPEPPPEPELTTPGPFVLRGLAPGLCRFRAQIEGTDLVATREVEVIEGWTELPAIEGMNPRAVWGSGATDLHVVGSRTEIVDNPDGSAMSVSHVVAARSSDGTTWTLSTPAVKANDEGYGHLLAVWGSGPTDVFAAGTRGTVIRFDAANWAEMNSATTENLNALSGTGGADVFAVGEAGAIVHYDGVAWSAMDAGVSVTLRDVWAAGPADVFAAGDAGTLLHYDGLGWTPMDTGSADDLHAVWSGGGGDVVVGGRDRLLSWNGAAWEVAASATGQIFRDIWGADPDSVYAIGPYNALFRRDGVPWRSETIPGTPTSLWGFGPRDLYTVDVATGALLRYR